MIIVHGMGPHGIAAFLFSPRNAKKLWSGWGFDYYGDDKNADFDLISPATKELMLCSTFEKRHYSIDKAITTQIISIARHRAARITDYFSAPIQSDFEIFKNRFENYSCEYTQINYGSIAETFAKGISINQGKNILVGNSAHQTNNHIDIFKILTKLDLENRKVIVPLSYGDSYYRKVLIANGEKLLGNSFTPLVNILPLDQYNSIVSSCNIVIMNHLRQQALGNIGTALYQGAHLFLNPSSPVYHFFKARNALLHTTEDLESHSLPAMGLLPEEIVKNRAVLEELWGHEKIRANIDALLLKAGI